MKSKEFLVSREEIKSVLSQAAKMKILESLEEQPHLAHPAEDVFFEAIDFWSSERAFVGVWPQKREVVRKTYRLF